MRVKLSWRKMLFITAIVSGLTILVLKNIKGNTPGKTLNTNGIIELQENWEFISDNWASQIGVFMTDMAVDCLLFNKRITRLCVFVFFYFFIAWKEMECESFYH